MFVINEKDVEKGGKVSKWLIGPWNTSIKDLEVGISELNKGDVVKAHFHKKVQEVIYLIDGVLEVEDNDEKQKIFKGTAVYFEPIKFHSFKVLSECAKILAIKSPSLSKDKFYI